VKATLLAIFALSHLSLAHEHYTNEWAVEIKGGIGVAKKVAEKHGFELGQKVRTDCCNIILQ